MTTILTRRLTQCTARTARSRAPSTRRRSLDAEPQERDECSSFGSGGDPTTYLDMCIVSTARHKHTISGESTLFADRVAAFHADELPKPLLLHLRQLGLFTAESALTTAHRWPNWMQMHARA